MGNIRLMYLNDKNAQSELEEIFGKDSKLFYNTCKRIKYNWLHFYGENSNKRKNTNNFHKLYESLFNKYIRITFAIARDHNIYLYWHGNSIPANCEMWDIFKDDKRIARIFIDKK